MAESFVSDIAVNLVGKIASLVRDEVALAWGLETDLKKLEELLTTVKAVLLDAEEKQAQSRELRDWLGMLKNFCYDAEDVLDELEYEGLRKTVLKQHGNTKIRVRRFFSSSNPLVFRLKMGHKVKKLRERLNEIADQKSKFHLSELVDFRQTGHRSREMTDSLLRTSNVIGRDGDKEKILEFLLDQKETLSVIPIVGLGGMGKTTLAKMLYNDESVDKHFDIKIWVCVSEVFEKKQIMVSMIKSLTLQNPRDQNPSDLDPDQLQRLIQENLNSKRFLLVLDDVWSDDRDKWNKFRELLGGGVAGSKVIVTTRYNSVAKTVRTGPLHKLEGLSHEQCLSLFKKLAFPEGEEESHPHLMQIGDEIVKNCGGVPLAVKTMGTLLFSNSDEHSDSDERYWKSIRDSETWKLEQKDDDILPALKLSYVQLPSHLKPCFAICSIFSKDYGFRSDELSQIWVANGLLQSSNKQRDMEDIGVQYIKELYSRSFLQDLEGDGDVMYFKMHDLVHDLALSISISQKECFVVDTRIEKIPDGIRHLAFSDKVSWHLEALSFPQEENSLRTLIFPYGLTRILSESVLNTWIFASKHLRVLNLNGFHLEVLPSSIGSLKHLRHLDLGNLYKIKRLPDSIGKLHSLLYLNLENCEELEELPKDIGNLKHLRYLNLEGLSKMKRLPDSICKLYNLLYLNLSYGFELEELPRDIGNMKHLRQVNLYSLCKIKRLPDSICKLHNLLYLDLHNCIKLEELPRDIGNLKQLRRLYIDSDEIKRLPDSICTLHNLLYLELDCSELEELPSDIGNLIKLRELDIVTKQKRLPDDGIGCLKSLQNLCIRRGYYLEYLFEDIQRLTSLRSLSILFCGNLISLPRNLKYLNSLEELRIEQCDQFDWMEEDDIQDTRLSLQYLNFDHLPKVVTLPPWLQKSSKTLRCLEVYECANFSSFPEWLQDFTSIEKFVIIECPKLASLPEEMHRLTSLKELRIGGCPMLSERCKRLEGEDWHKIAHVPYIEIDSCAFADAGDLSSI